MILAKVCLPWPPRATSPNASGQGQWRRKASAAKGYKLACWALCEAEKIRPVDAISVDVCQSARNFDPLSAPNNDPAWSARVAGPMRCSLHTAQPDRASGVSVIPAS